ncbi:MAG: HAD family hydrolase [Gemmatimonadota bacterium]|nr:HAD family hydrolase [Gemmatimonadota bacterium]
MTIPAEVVFLIDCDDTLFDNDHVERDIGDQLARELGLAVHDGYWDAIERLRTAHGVTDYLGALQCVRASDLSDAGLLRMSAFLLDYPFATRLYPAALDVIRHLSQWGTTIILSDGDVVFQPLKIQRSGLWDAVDGRVLISIHKEQILDVVAAAYPARHYTMIDDKLRILTAVKHTWGGRVTTVYPHQGHYAHDRQTNSAYPAADLTIERIGDLLDRDLAALLAVPAAADTLRNEGSP